MPARGKSVYTVPGGGTVVRAKSGRAKSYDGPGPAPAGTKKVRPKTAATAPTVTVSSTGDVSTKNFASPAAATVAKRRQRGTRQRVRKIEAVVLSSQSRRRVRRKAASTPPVAVPKYTADPAKAVISTKPNPEAKPAMFQGRKTAGTPTRAELQHAVATDALKANKAGFVTTPAIRDASKELKQAKRVVKKSQPKVSGLSPAERDVLPLARKAHRKYPDVPVSVLMAQDKQESGFNPAAVSSAGAQGLSQFIPGTAASYDVRYGTGPKEKQSQVTGQAHLLHDKGFATDPQGALSAYSGGYKASDYNNPILVDAKASYSALDKPGNPKARKRLVRAKGQAAALGLRAGGPARQVGPAPKKVVTRFKAIKSAAKELEAQGFPYSWGGGHDAGFSPGGEGENGGPGYDCSGAVSFVLHKAGVLSSPLTSGSMGSVLKPGPGAVTVFYNAEHTFMRIGDEYWGTSVGDNGAGGIGKHPAPSAAYLAQYSVGHVPGLGRKQALQMGIKMPAAGSTSTLPGMTLSAGGTTATIDPGAGVTKSGKAGYSSRPIQLTPFQEGMRTARKLKALGVKVRVPGEAKKEPVVAEPNDALSALQRRYGKAAV